MQKQITALEALLPKDKAQIPCALQKISDELCILSKKQGLSYGKLIETSIKNYVELRNKVIAEVKGPFPLTDRQTIKEILRLFEAEVAVIGGKVSTKGSIKISGTNFTRLPVDFLPFKYPGQNFDITGNRLTTLEGCPSTVTAQFDCAGNPLLSLKFAPKKVGTAIIPPLPHLPLGTLNNEIKTKAWSFGVYSNQEWDHILAYDYAMTTTPLAIVHNGKYDQATQAIEEFLEEHDFAPAHNRLVQLAAEKLKQKFQ